jgi:hypothetical protein
VSNKVPLSTTPAFSHKWISLSIIGSPIAYPTLQILHQYIVGYGIEEPLDIGIKNPVYLLARNSDRQRVQRVMAAFTWPEAIGETKKIHLIDDVQNGNHRTLNYLIRRNPNVRILAVFPKRRGRDKK